MARLTMLQSLLPLAAAILFLVGRCQSLAPTKTDSCQFVGFDLGTSGVRISVVQREQDGEGFEEVHSHAIPWKDGAYDSAKLWMDSVEFLLEHAKETSLGGTLERIAAICVSGTSASCLLIDGKSVGSPSRSPSRMYNYDVISSARAKGADPIHGVRALNAIEAFASNQHTARSATGSLAKLISWHDEKPLAKGERLCHQSDYISLRLMSNDKACGRRSNERFVYSDWHNCLKLGYDVRELCWPDWLKDCLGSVGVDAESVLPAKVVSPGEPMGTVSRDMARRLGLLETCIIVGGTTDSNAAFLAATADSAGGTPGTAVVSLGSTLAMKLVSTKYVEDSSVGVYSHRYPSVFLADDASQGKMGAWWLAGGASNVGCAVLRQEGFSVEELQELSKDIDPTTESPLSYYPLVGKGERFPVGDGAMEPVLQPKPSNRREYLHGILQGISTVEKRGFELMGALGASPGEPKQVWTCGGGAQNDVWSQMRERRLREAFNSDEIAVAKARNVEAGYGAALLAAAGAGSMGIRPK